MIEEPTDMQKSPEADAQTEPEDLESSSSEETPGGVRPEAGRCRALIQRAKSLYKTRRDESLGLAREALELAATTKDFACAAQALSFLAMAAMSEGRMEAASEQARQALEFAGIAGDGTARAGALNTLGALAKEQGDYDLAIKHVSEALAIAEQLGNDRYVARVCNNLSVLSHARGDLTRAIEYLQRSLAIKEKLGDRSGMGVAYMNLGLCYLDLGDWDKALESHFRALVEKEKEGDRTGMARFYSQLGDLYLKRDKIERAEFYVERALELVEEVPSGTLLCEVLSTVGRVALAARDFARAQGFFDRAFEITASRDYLSERAVALRDLAELDLAQGDFASCRAKLDQALEICSKTGQRSDEAELHRVLGELLEATGEAGAAIAAFERSSTVFRTLGQSYGLGCSLLALGRVLSRTGSDGQEKLSEAQAIFRNLGIAGKMDEAERLLRRPAALSPDLSQGLTELACRGMDLGDFCGQALRVLTAGLPAAGIAVLLRDGREYRHGEIAGEELGTTTTLALEAGGRRLGTLILRTGARLARLKPLADLLALGVSQALMRPALQLTGPEETGGRHPGIIGADTTLAEVFATIEQVAPTGANVLILGETGTGKELVARTLHDLSPRSERLFEAVNCAAIPETLLESELFGIEKNTATGVSAREGRFERAKGGTVFLDEIGDMSLALQAKMLRVLQERCFDRVGGRKPIAADVRVVAATNKNLEDAMAKGDFRRDLFYRLNVITISVPPLRERKQDIAALVTHFVGRARSEYSKPVQGVTDDCLACLMRHDWPGNIRELQNVIERGVILARGEMVTADNLPAGLQPAEGQETRWRDVRHRAVALAAAQVEEAAVLAALEQCGWVVKRAADRLGISRVQLHRIMNRLGLKRPERS